MFSIRIYILLITNPWAIFQNNTWALWPAGTLTSNLKGSIGFRAHILKTSSDSIWHKISRPRYLTSRASGNTVPPLTPVLGMEPSTLHQTDPHSCPARGGAHALFYRWENEQMLRVSIICPNSHREGGTRNKTQTRILQHWLHGLGSEGAGVLPVGARTSFREKRLSLGGFLVEIVWKFSQDKVLLYTGADASDFYPLKVEIVATIKAGNLPMIIWRPPSVFPPVLDPVPSSQEQPSGWVTCPWD